MCSIVGLMRGLREGVAYSCLEFAADGYHVECSGKNGLRGF